MDSDPQAFERKYRQRPQGARLMRNDGLIRDLQGAGISESDGPALLEVAAKASRHVTQHAIELHEISQGQLVDSNSAVPEGGPTSRIARQKVPFVVSPDNLRAKRLS